MNNLVREITNHCNLSCIHCSRDKKEKRIHMPYEMVEDIVRQAAALGIEEVCLTGGEPLLYPRLLDVLELFFSKGINVSIVSNGYLFKEILYPFFKRKPSYIEMFSICFSVDGNTAEIHDFLRGKEGSFNRVMEAIRLCHELDIPLSIKMAIWKYNIDHILDACLFALEHASEVGLIVLTPTPNLIKNDLIPSPKEYEEVIWKIKRKLIPFFSGVEIEGICDVDSPVPLCNPFFSGPNIDYVGNVCFCCNLSNTVMANKKGDFFLGNINSTSLDELFYKHLLKCSEFIRLMAKKAPNLWIRSCIYCSKIFGQMDWLKKIDSEWRNVIWNLPS